MIIKTVIRPKTEMKDSGVEWIGDIPKEWDVQCLKYAAQITSGSYISKDEYVDNGEFSIIGSNGEIGRCSKKNISHPVITTGRVGSIGTTQLVENAWVTDNTLILDVCDDFNREYLSYVVPNFDFKQILSGTAQPLITATKLKNQYIPLIGKKEQQVIADYLDETCSKIDEIIAEAKASIDEYKELKQSVIFEAVTKGLDKNVEMKQCSVNWLDEIPSTWESIRLKYLLTEINNRSETGTEQHLSVSQVMGVVPSYMIAVANPTASYVGQKIVEPNDIVFNKLKAHLGVFFMSKYHGLVSPDYAVYRTNDKVIPKYLEYLFHTSACISEFKKYISGVAEGLMRLYTSDLFNIRICLPKVDEQIQIVEYVENKVELFDSLIAEKESLINDLEAYKKSLIYEVVTGKRRVV